MVFEKKIFTPTKGSDVVLSTILPSMRDCDNKEDKKQKRNLSKNFKVMKIATSEDDEVLHSKRLKQIEEKIGKKTIWNS